MNGIYSAYDAVFLLGYRNEFHLTYDIMVGCWLTDGKPAQASSVSLADSREHILDTICFTSSITCHQ